MLNLDTLDTLIAVVLVLLVLSLVVQSIQSAIKKFFRLKSLQMEQSLIHLFYYALDRDPLHSMRTLMDRVPLLRAFFSLPVLRGLVKKDGGSLVAGDRSVQALYDGVAKELLRAGRITPGGKLQLDALTKEDLLKFLGRVRIDDLLSHLPSHNAQDLARINAGIDAARTHLESLFREHRKAIAKTPLARIELPLLQLLNNADQFLSPTSEAFTLEDLARFGAAEITQARAILTEMPDSIEQTVLALKDHAGEDLLKSLQTLEAVLQPLHDEFDKIVALPAKLSRLKGQTEEWYDTIMQSFAERYARSMKSCAILISVVVVILLNANFFTIYREISSNDIKRNLIVQSSQNILGELQKQQAANAATAPQQSAEEWAKQSAAEIDKSISIYTGLGFEGPRWMLEIPTRVRTAGIRGFLETLVGWTIMTLLLSVGAPFWQDTLESLFGLKNLLRKSGKGPEEKS
ncbi:MAG: hypothetical protein SF339_13865 [Blastocatellia bacterium]|nr:hypothetical protein [Blastocatellia bacterium]